MNSALHLDFTKIPLAHRALHDVAAGRPENSRAAIRAAMAAGYGIEIDVQASADAQAMVFHDDTLPRLSHGEGRISVFSAAELAAVQLRGGDEGIPTLAEVLEIVAGRVPLLIEVKDQDGAMGPNVGPLEDAVALALRHYKGPVAVMSFNPHSVRHLAQVAPDIARGLVTCAFDPAGEDVPPERCAELRQISNFDELGCSFISHDRADLDADRVRELKDAGAHILCWTVKSAQQEAEARKIAENITFEQYLPAISA